MSDLRDLFHQPQQRQIGAATFTVYKLQFSQFADALVLGRFLEALDIDADSASLLEELQKLADDSPERQALKRTLAGCLAVTLPGESGGQRQLQPDDIEVMPIIMQAEAIAVVMEENADFFSQTLPRLLRAGLRIKSIGLALLKPWSEPGTDPTA